TAPPAPAPAVRFQSSVVSLDRRMQLLRAAPAALDGANLAAAFEEIAQSIANVPNADGVDVGWGASTIRSSASAIDAAALGKQTAENARGALETATGAMLLLSRGPYAGKPEVATAIASLKRATDALEPGVPLATQRG